MRRITRAREQAKRLDHYLEIRYEGLILDTEPTLREVCEFFELPWDDAVLDYHQRSAERLEEMKRELPDQGKRTALSVELRMKTHARTTEKPDPKRVSRWRESMDRGDRELLRVDRRTAAGGARLRRPATAREPSRAGSRGDVVRIQTPFSRSRKPAGPPVPFIVGVTRSGTTLLRLMLDAHPDLAIPPETHFVPSLIKATRKRGVSCDEAHGIVTGHRQWGDFNLDSAELLRRYCELDRIDPETTIRAFFELYAEREGKPRWGDKTPNYVRRMKQIERWIPEARFIHMIRDGRDAALSRFKRVLKEPPPMETVAERWVKKIEGARADAAGPALHRGPVRGAGPRHRDAAAPGQPSSSSCPGTTRCSATTSAPRSGSSEMHRDLPGEDGKPLRPADHRKEAHVLTSKPPDPSRLARWKEEMAPADVAAFERVAEPMLRELGYEVPGRAPRRRRGLACGEPGPLAQLGGFGAPTRERPSPAPFVVGLTRSGTTLLRMMLDAHRELTIPPETHFVPDLIKAARAEAGTDAMLAAMTGNRTWDDFGIDADEMRERLDAVPSAATAPRRSAPSSTPTPSARASRAGATRRPPTCSPSSGSGGRCPSPASST